MERLVVKKRDNIACWKVDAEGVYPNTVIELASGVTLLIKAEGKSVVCAKSGITLVSLLTPGKKSKLIGGKTPYDHCEIYAVDTTSDFRCEWGLAAGKALNCKDPEFNVEAKAIARGTYQHHIKDYFKFISCFSFDNKTDITRENVRDYFRTEAENVVAPYLGPKVAAGVEVAQVNMGSYTEDIKYILNRNLANKGVEVVSFAIDAIDYEPAHKVHREALKKAKIGVAIKGVINDGRRDDISVEKDASEIDIGIINALNGNGGNNGSSKSEEKPSKKVTCSRCGEENDAKDNYCAKCGEKLHK